MLKPSKLSHKSAILLVAIIISSAFFLRAAADTLPVAEDSSGKYLADRLIVVCEYGSPLLITGESQSNIAVSGIESIDLLCRKYDVTRIEPFYPGKLRHPALIREVSRMYIFYFAEPTDVLALIPDFSADSHIDFAERYDIPEPCYVPNDPDISDQWYLEHTDAYLAWDTVRGDTTKNAIIAIVDTGVYWDHPDLAANIWINSAEDVNQNGVFDSGDNDGIDADSNGYIDDVIGWDLGVNDNNPAEEEPYHGTAVAGTASEVTNNGIDGASIGYSARLMCVKASNHQNQLTMCYQGIVYAADQGANIINCSWGNMSYQQSSQNILNAVYEEGVLVVAGAGGHGDTTRTYPGGYDHVIAVGATDQTDHITQFSGRGDWVDIYAPGIDILTTWGQSSQTTFSGTSFSAPMVCGLAALIKCWYPEYSPDDIEETIKSSANSIGYINPSYSYAIRLNCNNWLLTGIEESPTIEPKLFTLLQNYPNPFNSQTEIRFDLVSESDVSISLFDISGRRVLEHPCGVLNAGFHSIRIDGKGMASGVYFYRLQSAGISAVRKCLLLK